MRLLVPLIAALLLLAAPAAAQRPIGPADVEPHLAALQAVADANGGNRAAGRPGEPATVAYIASTLSSLGWSVTQQPVRFPYWEERAAPVVHDLVPGRDVVTLRGSGAGDVTAPVQRMRRSGCQRGDARGFRRGRIALVPPGPCFFRESVQRFRRAGAVAVVLATKPGPTGLLPATLLRSVPVPAVLVTRQAARRLVRAGTPVRLAVDAFSETRTATNVIAERRGTSPREVVMAGGHLDSVPEGPGMNDNASGVAALLAIASRIDEMSLRDTVRLGFWSAEEWGLWGSNRYVRRLSRRARRQIGVYLNADMVGSPNGSFDVYDAHPTVDGPLLRRLRGADQFNFYGSSDNTAFVDARIPASGVFTGSDERKTRAQARRWGGRAGEPRDPCYHRPCDTIANVDRAILTRAANALAGAMVAFARR